MPARREPGFAEAAAFGAGSLATGVFSTVPSVLLLYFCTQLLGIDPGIAALILLLPKIWSMAWDPLVGHWSDRSGGRFGRRRPFLLAGGAGMCLGFMLLFAPPEAGPMATALWVAAAYFALTTFYSVYAVPYSALPAELATTVAGTARLVSLRMAFVMAGVFAGAVLAPLLVAGHGGGREGYAAMGRVLGLACLLSVLAPLWTLARSESAPPTVQGGGLRAAMAEVWRDRAFRRLAFAFLFTSSALGALSAVLPYAVTVALGRGEADIAVALGAMVGATLLALPGWNRAVGRIGLRPALLLAAGGYAASAILLAVCLWMQLGWGVSLAAMALVGAHFAGLQLLPFTLAADHIRAASGGAEGRYTGVWISIEKLGLAAGAALLALALARLGAARTPLLAGFLAIVPPLCCLFAVLLVRTPTHRESPAT